MKYNQINELITDWRAYLEGKNDMYGAKEIEFPELKNLTTDIEGIGIAGKINAPVHGHFDSTEVTIKWQVPNKMSLGLFGGRPISIEAYGDIQGFKSGETEYAHDQLYAAIRGRIKSAKPGTMKAGDAMESETVIEAHYIKIEYEGNTILEVDKYGYKTVIDGVDVLEDIRKNIGMCCEEVQKWQKKKI